MLPMDVDAHQRSSRMARSQNGCFTSLHFFYPCTQVYVTVLLCMTSITEYVFNIGKIKEVLD